RYLALRSIKSGLSSPLTSAYKASIKAATAQLTLGAHSININLGYRALLHFRHKKGRELRP
ncbi:MAG: hypothetical protein ABJI60_09410, partial [Kangiellaceae bacterium]